ESALDLVARHCEAALRKRLMQPCDVVAEGPEMQASSRHGRPFLDEARRAAPSVELELQQHEGARIARHELDALDDAEEVLRAFLAHELGRRLAPDEDPRRLTGERDQQSAVLRQAHRLLEAAF